MKQRQPLVGARYNKTSYIYIYVKLLCSCRVEVVSLQHITRKPTQYVLYSKKGIWKDIFDKIFLTSEMPHFVSGKFR